MPCNTADVIRFIRSVSYNIYFLLETSLPVTSNKRGKFRGVLVKISQALLKCMHIAKIPLKVLVAKITVRVPCGFRRVRANYLFALPRIRKSCGWDFALAAGKRMTNIKNHI